FAYIRYMGGVDAAQDAKVEALEKAGHPVVRIELADLINLGEEFFLWEMATAVAGSLLGINAFDQPNVQESKDYTKNFLDRDKKKAATTLGYGPRFLHSTGQLHKGGPSTGVFLQITSDDAEDLPIPGEPYTFGVLKSAQALGDFLSLSKRNRRALRVHLGKDVNAGLKKLQQAVEKVLS